MYIVRAATASRHVSLTVLGSLEYPEQAVYFGGTLRPIRAGFQNANSARLAGSSHHDCEQVAWRVKRASSRSGSKQVKAGQGQVELCGWAPALSAYLAGEAVDSSGQQWRTMESN